jgi:hypothetical protein
MFIEVNGKESEQKALLNLAHIIAIEPAVRVGSNVAEGGVVTVVSGIIHTVETYEELCALVRVAQ